MLLEIDRICKKCGIKYCLIGGTALGAVRHGGFIPWDDDIDVGFMRPEYEKFIEACKTELDSERFYFQDYRHTKGYRWGYGKLRRKNTLFMRLNQDCMPYEQGIFVDLFVIDNCPDVRFLQPLHNFVCFLFRKASYSKIGRLEAKGFGKLAYEFLYLIPEKTLYRALDNFIKINNKKESKRVRTLLFPLSKTKSGLYGYQRTWYEELTEIEFEGHKLPIMKDYHDYLTFKYGDYMKLPDEKDRQTHPVSQLKLLGEEK